VFTPIATERLVLRPFEAGDLDGYLARRNDPDVARFQDWELPYTEARAREAIDSAMELGMPTDGEWWMAAVSLAETGEVVGDVGCEMTWAGRSADIGYTFASEHWGKGYAVEAAGALVEYLFVELGVTRVSGMLHPDNPASAMVLERLGMLFEGHSRSSFWVGDECSDDWLYGMTRSDWEAWRNRPRDQPGEVALTTLEEGRQWEAYDLRTHKTQEAFVAPMTDSYADALFPEHVDGWPVAPWMRGVTADGVMVGFVMLALATEHHPEPFLWRLLVDRMHQRRGIGSAVIGLVAEECLRNGNETLLVSWAEGRGSPRDFYVRHGFVPTGRIVDGEIEARKVLA
jgi:RimJ/RimL family protein N-acetyltransferase